MLVIRRRAGESFWIGDCVEVEVVEVSAGKVKLGIRAPKEISVLRSEVMLTQRQNRLAAGVTEEAMARLISSLKPR